MGSVRIPGTQDRGRKPHRPPSSTIQDPQSSPRAGGPLKDWPPLPRQGRTFPAFGKRKNIPLFRNQVKRDSFDEPDSFLCCRQCFFRARPDLTDSPGTSGQREDRSVWRRLCQPSSTSREIIVRRSRFGSYMSISTRPEPRTPSFFLRARTFFGKSQETL